MNGNYEISVAKQTGRSEMTRYHYHNYYEIYYLCAGDRRYYVEDRTYSVTKGSILFINKNDIHKTVETKQPGHERILIYFTDEFLEKYPAHHLELLLSPFQPSKMLQFNNQEQNVIENLLFQMVQEYSAPERSGQSLYFESLLVQLLLFASRKINASSKAAFHPKNAKISEIIAFCNESYKQSLTLEEISKRFFISPHYFSRIFKQYTGFNFNEYLNTLRIREAQRLLRESSHKIITISEQVGYLNITHFNRKFKQVTRMSPIEYKKMVKSALKVVEIDQ